MNFDHKTDVGLIALILLIIITAIVFFNKPDVVGEDDIDIEAVATSISVITTTETTDVTTTNITTSGTTAVNTTSADTTTETATETTVTEVPQEEQKPETNAPETEAPKQEDPQPEPEPEPIKEPERAEPTEEFLVYKPSTYYIHRNTCRWNKGDAYRVDSVEGLEARLCNECNPKCEGFTEYVAPVEEAPSSDGLTYVGEFQATYYTAWIGACGGSGRSLIDCSYGSEVKGSIASSTLYNLYGYYRNGRTTVYIECDSCPALTGYYYLDDSTASWVTYTIDFYYESGYNCPFQYTGRLYGLRIYVD